MCLYICRLSDGISVVLRKKELSNDQKNQIKLIFFLYFPSKSTVSVITMLLLFKYIINDIQCDRWCQECLETWLVRMKTTQYYYDDSRRQLIHLSHPSHIVWKTIIIYYRSSEYVSFSPIFTLLMIFISVEMISLFADDRMLSRAKAYYLFLLLLCLFVVRWLHFCHFACNRTPKTRTTTITLD